MYLFVTFGKVYFVHVTWVFQIASHDNGRDGADKRGLFVFLEIQSRKCHLKLQMECNMK